MLDGARVACARVAGLALGGGGGSVQGPNGELMFYCRQPTI